MRKNRRTMKKNHALFNLNIFVEKLDNLIILILII